MNAYGAVFSDAVRLKKMKGMDRVIPDDWRRVYAQWNQYFAKCETCSATVPPKRSALIATWKR